MKMIQTIYIHASNDQNMIFENFSSGCVCGANVHDGNSIACLDNADTCTDTGCECSTNEDSEVCDLNSGTPICRWVYHLHQEGNKFNT